MAKIICKDQEHKLICNANLDIDDFGFNTLDVVKLGSTDFYPVPQMWNASTGTQAKISGIIKISQEALKYLLCLHSVWGFNFKKEEMGECYIVVQNKAHSSADGVGNDPYYNVSSHPFIVNVNGNERTASTSVLNTDYPDTALNIGSSDNRISQFSVETKMYRINLPTSSNPSYIPFNNKFGFDFENNNNKTYEQDGISVNATQDIYTTLKKFGTKDQLNIKLGKEDKLCMFVISQNIKKIGKVTTFNIMLPAYNESGYNKTEAQTSLDEFIKNEDRFNALKKFLVMATPENRLNVNHRYLIDQSLALEEKLCTLQTPSCCYVKLRDDITTENTPLMIKPYPRDSDKCPEDMAIFFYNPYEKHIRLVDVNMDPTPDKDYILACISQKEDQNTWFQISNNDKNKPYHKIVFEFREGGDVAFLPQEYQSTSDPDTFGSSGSKGQIRTVYMTPPINFDGTEEVQLCVGIEPFYFTMNKYIHEKDVALYGGKRTNSNYAIDIKWSAIKFI